MKESDDSGAGELLNQRTKYDVKSIDGFFYVVRRDGAKTMIYLDIEEAFHWDTAIGVIHAVNEIENRPAAQRRSKFHILPFP